VVTTLGATLKDDDEEFKTSAIFYFACPRCGSDEAARHDVKANK
jgi:hypothetical protein